MLRCATSVLDKKVLVLLVTVLVGFFLKSQGQSLRLRQALLASGDFLNDVDGDNIPGQAGIDYPVHWKVPEGTSFRCKDYDYAGYFADVESDCQAYHVCFPDGRNASFLCVNGTVLHQRYFVCDWWFHFNCSHAPSLYELNLFRKVPLPVLPPVARRPFPGPALTPKPIPSPISPPPRSQQREPKELVLSKIDETDKKRKKDADSKNWPKNRNTKPGESPKPVINIPQNRKSERDRFSNTMTSKDRPSPAMKYKQSVNNNGENQCDCRCNSDAL